jgi:hypothetical protein
MATGDIKPRSAYRLLIAVLLAFNAFAQTIDEYQLKAAFLYNFAKFVEWPALTFKTDKDPMRICVLGQNPFGGALGEAVAGKTVSGRSFAVADISNASQAADCQMLFVSSSERQHLPSIFGALRTMGILTVGETEGFAAQGGVVNFRLEGGRVRLEINIEAAERAKLRISSKVLSLAQIVKPELKK